MWRLPSIEAVMGALRGIIILGMGLSAAAASPDWSSGVHIPQVSNLPQSPARLGEKEKEALLKEKQLLESQEPQDYQAEVINNPKFTDYGRARAAIQANEAAIGESGANPAAIKQDAESMILNEDQLGRNIAVIRQEGSHNSSSVVQQGKDNKAVQVQKGEHNDLSVKQTGERNESYEEQVGKYNHKRKVQNGIVVEKEEEGQ